MSAADVSSLRALVPRGLRLLGLDLGKKTIGLALCDAGWLVATPLCTIERTRLARDLGALQAVVAEREVGGLVLGLPVSMDGREGPRCQSVRQFAHDVERALSLPLAFWDERLSTTAVERFLIEEADLSRGKRRKVIDRAAAAWILQGALDAIRFATAGGREPRPEPAARPNDP